MIIDTESALILACTLPVYSSVALCWKKLFIDDLHTAAGTSAILLAGGRMQLTHTLILTVLRLHVVDFDL